MLFTASVHTMLGVFLALSSPALGGAMASPVPAAPGFTRAASNAVPTTASWLGAVPGGCGVGGFSSVGADDVDSTAALTPPPAYYAVELVTTRRVPGTLRASGTAQVQFGGSPFGVSVAPDGQYVYDLDVRVEDIRWREDADFVVWVTTPQLDEVRRLGVLGEDGRLRGHVGWNKFLVVVTMEPADEPAGDMWRGPIVLRGVSRSGMMHTMAGHGPFEGEPCAKYGY